MCTHSHSHMRAHVDCQLAVTKYIGEVYVYVGERELCHALHARRRAPSPVPHPTQSPRPSPLAVVMASVEMSKARETGRKGNGAKCLRWSSSSRTQSHIRRALLISPSASSPWLRAARRGPQPPRRSARTHRERGADSTKRKRKGERKNGRCLLLEARRSGHGSDRTHTSMEGGEREREGLPLHL